MSIGAKSLLNFFLIICLFTLLTNGRRYRTVGRRESEQLDKEQRNAECCAKKMRCCVKPPVPPIAIRALLARCPNLGHEHTASLSRIMNKPLLSANEIDLRSFQGFDEDEPLVQSRVTNCMQKVLMTLKMHHNGVMPCINQYVVVDHVYDPVTERTTRLLNPYVVKLRQGSVSKSFRLKFVDYVNSEAKEQVFNKHDGNYTGCYASRYRSTCGLVKYNGEIIPFSEGFCCSCDTKLNLQRQPESFNEKNEEIVSASDPTYLLDRVACPRDFYDDNATSTTVSVLSNNTSTTKSANEEVSVPRRSAISSPGRWKYTTYETKHTPVPTQRSYLKNKRSDDEANNPPPHQYMEKLLQGKKRIDPKNYMDEVKKMHSTNGKLEGILKELSLSNDNDENFFKHPLIRNLRQTFPSGIQKRGGQNCASRVTPSGLDPDHYHESTHCLRFSDVWYGVYKLGASEIVQSVRITIYERYESELGANTWRDITNGTVVLSDESPLYENELPSISLKYSSKVLSDPDKYGHLNGRRILIPEGVKECEVHRYPEMRGGPPEYLVVKADRIAMEGDQCDRIGVGFEAFLKQPQRCGMPKGTCLHGQPKHLWRYDKRLERKGKKGCHFLKYHANLTDDPIMTNVTTGEKYLKVEYNGAQLSTIDIEIKADFNAVIREISTAVITEVYVDSTCSKVAFITIKVINTGLISARFYVQLSDFPLDVPEYFSTVKSKPALIGPQTVHIYTLEIRHPLPADLMYCSAEVLNEKKELVALRRVRIQKYDRCICTWYCLCACIGSSEGLTCNPMSLEHYHAAGFEGALPIVTYMIHFTMLDDLLSLVIYFALFLLGILLVMGLCKALLGLCCFNIGIWGLSVVLDLPKPMKRYYERKLRNYDVIYDKNGWPVNPQTFQPARNISKATEFCANLVFFFTYPLACTVIIVRRLCCPYYTKTIYPSDAMYRDDKSSKSSKGNKSKKKICDRPDCNKKNTQSSGGTGSSTSHEGTKNKKTCKTCFRKRKSTGSKEHESKDHKSSCKEMKSALKTKTKCNSKECKKNKSKSSLSSSRGSKTSTKDSKTSTQSDVKSTKSKNRLITAFAFPESRPMFNYQATKSNYNEPHLILSPTPKDEERPSTVFDQYSDKANVRKQRNRRDLSRSSAIEDRNRSKMQKTPSSVSSQTSSVSSRVSRQSETATRASRIPKPNQTDKRAIKTRTRSKSSRCSSSSSPPPKPKPRKSFIESERYDTTSTTTMTTQTTNSSACTATTSEQQEQQEQEQQQIRSPQILSPTVSDTAPQQAQPKIRNPKRAVSKASSIFSRPKSM